MNSFQQGNPYQMTNQQSSFQSTQMTNQTPSFQMTSQTSSFNVCSDMDVNSLITSIKKATFSSDMVNALKLGVNSKFFSCQQGFKIVKTFSFDGDQKQACLILYDHLSDKNNISVMLDACTFQSTKTDVMKTLKLI